MEISERIKKIIDSEGLTASEFAEMIGIQRSNVSHILNGRNGQPSNPSFEVLQKILNAFPHYNTDWLVMGRGEIYRQPVQTSIFDVIDEPEPTPVTQSGFAQEAVEQPSDSAVQAIETQLFGDTDNGHLQAPVNTTQATAETIGVSEFAAQAVQRAAEVKQIVVLYTDNTFAIYNQK